jgi:hypothetical protein
MSSEMNDQERRIEALRQAIAHTSAEDIQSWREQKAAWEHLELTDARNA